MSQPAYVHPGNGPARSKAQRAALATLARLVEVDRDMAARTLADIEKSSASAGF